MYGDFTQVNQISPIYMKENNIVKYQCENDHIASVMQELVSTFHKAFLRMNFRFFLKLSDLEK